MLATWSVIRWSDDVCTNIINCYHWDNLRNYSFLYVSQWSHLIIDFRRLGLPLLDCFPSTVLSGAMVRRGPYQWPVFPSDHNWGEAVCNTWGFQHGHQHAHTGVVSGLNTHQAPLLLSGEYKNISTPRLQFDKYRQYLSPLIEWSLYIQYPALVCIVRAWPGLTTGTCGGGSPGIWQTHHRPELWPRCQYPGSQITGKYT